MDTHITLQGWRGRVTHKLLDRAQDVAHVKVKIRDEHSAAQTVLSFLSSDPAELRELADAFTDAGNGLAAEMSVDEGSAA